VRAAGGGGLGAAFLSRSQLGPGELGFVRLAGIDLRRPICAVWRRDRPPEAVAQDLMTHLVSTAHGQEG